MSNQKQKEEVQIIAEIVQTKLQIPEKGQVTECYQIDMAASEFSLHSCLPKQSLHLLLASRNG